MTDHDRRPRDTEPPTPATSGAKRGAGPAQENSVALSNLPAASEDGGLLGLLMSGASSLYTSARDTLTDTTPLRVGDSGVRVLMLQSQLRRIGFELALDGAYGPDTEAKVIAFQLQSGLTPDGIAGPLTMDALLDVRTVAEEEAHEQRRFDEPRAAQPDPGTGGDFDIPLRDVIYEQLAHRVAYLQFPSGFQLHAPEDVAAFEAPRKDKDGGAIPKWLDETSVQTLLDKLGYTPQVVHEDRLTGFQVVLFTPTLAGVEIADHPFFKWLGPERYRAGPGLRPALAFRGSQDTASWADDSNPEGVGAYQFRMNEADIVKLLAMGQSDAGAPDVIGHSLGGALAQLTAARYGSMVNECVTFQAAAITRDEALQAGRSGVDSTHYRVQGDLVPLAGRAFTPGVEETFRSGAGGLGKFSGAHTSYPLQDIHLHDKKKGGAHLPALDAFHAEERPNGNWNWMGRLHPRREVEPSSGRQGEQDWGRTMPLVGDFRSSPEHYLNGAITRLFEELRAMTTDAQRRPDFDVDAHIATLTQHVDQRRATVIDEAAREAMGYDRNLVQYYASKLVPLWQERRDRIVDQASRLARMQASRPR